MELLDTDTLRMLRYLATVPTGIPVYYFNQFGEGDPRRGMFGPMKRSFIAGHTETWASCFERIGWATKGKDDMLRLSGFGREVLAGAGASSLPSPRQEQLAQVVLSVEDNLAYPKLLAEVLALGECLLVDPYLRAGQFIEVVGATQVSRFLVSPKIGSEEKAIIARALRDIPDDERPEVRVSDALHDRLAIPDSGNALGFGLSLNGFGYKTTTLVTYSPEVTRLLRSKYDEIWNDAEVVEPGATLAGQPATSSSPG